MVFIRLFKRFSENLLVNTYFKLKDRLEAI